MKKIAVLGSTGSIGVNTLKIAEEHPDQFEVVGLAAGSKAEELAEQVRRFRPKAVALQDASRAAELQRRLDGFPGKVLIGEEGVEALAGMDGVDQVVVAITGAAALKPTLSAIGRGRAIGLANKETLVMAGELVTRRAKENAAALLPIDSEHSAIFQCLQGHSGEEVRKILLTTSGGPLRAIPAERFGSLKKEEIMNHPRWKMGPKITVDSATMMNKALEVIEARWLFDLPVERIEVVVHPEAIVHSMVEFIDGSVLAQLGVTDMRIPIQYALSFPRRLSSSLPPLDLVAWKQLTFEAPDPEKFPCLQFGRAAARAGGTAPAALNAANEACVQAFLQDSLPFTRIPSVIERILSRQRIVAHPSLEEILRADAWAREQVLEAVG
ncbi:MAG: 1-deoxy-D-xylulose-5-phosphate reductoisomerase [Candidatus Omnitrophica bacterium]|nr:1-deoxy-D-xylulose-5-phosphate reductoisomerase [Candidatus Omnitrophota bacterium]